jgi:hypothetical protein
MHFILLNDKKTDFAATENPTFVVQNNLKSARKYHKATKQKNPASEPFSEHFNF